MKEFKLISFLTVCCAFLVNSAYADSYALYYPSTAANYAISNVHTDYGSSYGQNPFGDYGGDSGGNCTNFVSQAIMAGMSGYTTPALVYSQRTEFDIDAGGGAYQWYYTSDSNRGPAFTGASKMYEYAVYNYSWYKGLHFQYVTHDTPTEFMDYNSVQVGDVIFVDWTGNGSIDHSMLVTAKKYWWQESGYNKIRVTYQGDEYGVGINNKGLGDLNEDFNYQALFYVYRPVDYNPNGS